MNVNSNGSVVETAACDEIRPALCDEHYKGKTDHDVVTRIQIAPEMYTNLKLQTLEEKYPILPALLEITALMDFKLNEMEIALSEIHFSGSTT